jgi:hypothetical protein
MQFHKGADIVARRLAAARRIEADVAHGVGDQRAIVAHNRFGIVWSDGADDRARAPKVGRKPAGFFLAEGNRLERPARRAKLAGERGNRNQSPDRPQRAVVAAAGGHGVDMGAGRNRRPTLASLQPAPDIADRIAPHGERGVPAPLGVLVRRRDPFRRIGRSPHAGFAMGAEARKLGEPALNLRGIDVDVRHCCASSRSHFDTKLAHPTGARRYQHRSWR